MLIRYLKQLLQQWFALFFPALDLILLAGDLYEPELSLPPIVYLLVLLLWYIVANIRLYAEQARKIAEYEEQEADIRIEVISASLNCSTGGGGFPDSKVGPSGLNENGLPKGAIINTKLSFRNVGYKPGELEWEVDYTKTKLPPMFTLEENLKGSLNEFWGMNKSRLAQQDYGVEAQPFFRLRLAECKDPLAFAQSLRDLRSEKHEFVIKYRTKRISGYSKWQSLEIRVNLEKFIEKVSKLWRDEGLDHLAALADPDHK